MRTPEEPSGKGRSVLDTIESAPQKEEWALINKYKAL